ncbi:MAG: choice-of-anchor J domain-containing protein, partial [Arenicellales bacterium]|nr:choice-of-anchor J domain-containing protein [Arenicellales bacterium]
HTMLNLNQYFIKVTGASSTTVGAYLLTKTETTFNANHGTLVINEIHYNPATGLEFVELYNSGATAIDMSGYTWSGITSTIATGTSIAAGGYFLADSLTAASLNDAGETIELKDSTGALVDEVTYDDASPWPTGADGGGSSLELINASANNNVGSNWRGHGKSGGTPGAANSAQPDLSMGASIASYVGAGTSSSANFQLKNNGDSGLTVDSVTASQFIPGTSYLDEGFEGTWSGSPAAPSGWTVINNNGDADAWISNTSSYYSHSGSKSAALYTDYNSSNDDYLITPQLVLPSGGSYTLKFWTRAQSSSEPDELSVMLSTTTATVAALTTTLMASTPINFTTYAEYEIDLSSYAGSSVYIAFVRTEAPADGWNLYLDDVSVDAPGTNVVPTWLSATAPSTAIAGGDSGNVSLAFNASSFSSDTSLSATVSVHNNDPQDSSDTFTATMTVRADTAILDLTSGAGAWLSDVGAVGDTVDFLPITIQNDGGASLVVDSVSLANGTHYSHDLADSTVIAANESASFKAYYTPQAVGTHLDTLAFNDNTDSTSGESITMGGYGHAATDTVWAFTNSSDATTWTLMAGTYSVYHSTNGYFYTVDGYVISPKVALDSASTLHFTFRNANASTFDARIFYSTDKDATVWTDWTAVDTVTNATSGVSGTTKYSRHEVTMPASADTGYVAIQFVAPTALVYYSYLHDVVLPPQVIEEEEEVEIPEGYTLESFETWPPEGWTLSPSSGSGSWQQDSGNDYGPGAANSGTYSAFFNDYDYSSGTSGSMTTRALDLTSVTSPTIKFYYWDSGGSDKVVVSVSTDGTTFTTVYTTATVVASWTQLTVDLSAYATNTTVYIKFTGTSVWGTSNPHIDDFSVIGAGSNVATTWLSATAPAAIAAGDSGDVSLTFDASSFTSDTTLSTTLNVFNNDPQDSSDTFTATMTVRADTAILDL